MRRSKPLAAFRSTSLQYEPSILTRHARAEAMRLGTASVVRLEGPLGHMIAFLPSNETVRLNGRLFTVKKRRLFWPFENLQVDNRRADPNSHVQQDEVRRRGLVPFQNRSAFGEEGQEFFSRRRFRVFSPPLS